MASTEEPQAEIGKAEKRLQAVLSVLGGERVDDVAARFAIPRSDLYKFRRRALEAMASALEDRPRGPRHPHNRLEPSREATVAEVCGRSPTVSSYRIRERLGPEAPSARTVQRVRGRQGLPRLPKRDQPRFRAKRLSPAEKDRIREYAKSNPYLGPQRIAWDLQNRDGIDVSPSTVKRVKREIKLAESPPAAPAVWRFYERRHPHSLWHGDLIEKITLPNGSTAYQMTLLDDYSRAYVYCDLMLTVNQVTTVAAMIEAMRAFETIPRAVLFDNGTAFKGRLVKVFCSNLGVRLIYTSVRHPQTNGKLERAHRDDLNEFYRRYDTLNFNVLRTDLGGYVHYRNTIRGHAALSGKPSTSRLAEQSWFALPSVLDNLERYADYTIGRRKISPSGCLRLFHRDAYVDTALAGREVELHETLDGLEVWVDGQSYYVLSDYRMYVHKYKCWRVPVAGTFRFEPVGACYCPRIAVAQ
jgi:putative transposase